MRVTLVLAAAMTAAGWASAGAAGLAPPGATACSGCHGSPEASVGPPIAGHPAGQIAAAMQAFRTGERPGTVMPRIAKGFSPEESEAIARWWSAARP